MNDLGDELLSGLPDEVRALLSTSPVTEKKLLELGVSLDGLSASQARMADAVRLFVITWDPLEILHGRPAGFATINADPAGLEVVVYAPLWSLAEQAAARDTTIVAVLSAMARSAVVTAAEHEQAVTSGQYPAAAARRGVPDLLSSTAAGFARGPAAVRLVSPGWEDIGLGAITDIVQHVFGPVDLTAHQWSSRRPPSPSSDARSVGGAGSASRRDWPRRSPRCVRPTTVRRRSSSTGALPEQCQQPGRVGGADGRIRTARTTQPAEWAGRQAGRCR